MNFATKFASSFQSSNFDCKQMFIVGVEITVYIRSYAYITAVKYWPSGLPRRNKFINEILKIKILNKFINEIFTFFYNRSSNFEMNL